MAWPSSLAECNRAPWPSYCVRVRSLIGVLASSLLATLIKLPRFSTPRRTAGRLAVEGAGPCPCTPLSSALPRPALGRVPSLPRGDTGPAGGVGAREAAGLVPMAWASAAPAPGLLLRSLSALMRSKSAFLI